MTADPIHSPESVPRSPEAIRAALRPIDRALFEEEFRAALEQARSSFSLEALDAVVEQWWRFANLADGHDQAIALADQIQAGQNVPVVKVDFAALRG